MRDITLSNGALVDQRFRRLQHVTGDLVLTDDVAIRFIAHVTVSLHVDVV